MMDMEKKRQNEFVFLQPEGLFASDERAKFFRKSLNDYFNIDDLITEEHLIDYLEQIGIIFNALDRKDFIFNFNPEQLSSEKDFLFKKYEELIDNFRSSFSNFMLHILQFECDHEPLFSSLNLSALKYNGEFGKFRIRDKYIFQTGGDKLYIDLYSVKFSSCTFSNICMRCTQNGEISIRDSRSSSQNTNIVIYLDNNSNLSIKNVEFSNLYFKQDQNIGGKVNFIDVSIDSISYEAPRLLKVAFDVDKIIENEIGILVATGQVTTDEFHIKQTHIGRVKMDSASAKIFRLENTCIDGGALPNGQIERFEARDTEFGCDNGRCTLSAHDKFSFIHDLEFYSVKIAGKLSITDWKFRSAVLLGVDLRNALEFSRVEFLAPPSAQQLRLDRKFEAERGRVLEVQAGLRALQQAAKQFSDDALNYSLKRLDAEMFGLRNRKEIGVPEWLVNHIYRVTSNYGLSANVPVIWFIILFFIFIFFTMSFLIYFGWEVDLSISGLINFFAAFAFFSINLLDATPLGIGFDPAGVELITIKTAHKNILIFSKVIFASFSYPLFFLFFLALRRRYQI